MDAVLIKTDDYASESVYFDIRQIDNTRRPNLVTDLSFIIFWGMKHLSTNKCVYTDLLL